MGPAWQLSTNGHGYALVNASMTWTAAASQLHYYENLTGYLATITTPAENAIIALMLASSLGNPYQYWIGARDLNSHRSRLSLEMGSWYVSSLIISHGFRFTFLTFRPRSKPHLLS